MSCLCSCSYAHNALFSDLVWPHHVVDALDDLGHLDEVDVAVAVDVVHAEGRKKEKTKKYYRCRKFLSAGRVARRQFARFVAGKRGVTRKSGLSKEFLG